MSGLSPWLAIKMVHFAGGHFDQIHSQANNAPPAPRQAMAVPQKLAQMSRGASAARPDRRDSSGRDGPVPVAPERTAAKDCRASRRPALAQRRVPPGRPARRRSAAVREPAGAAGGSAGAAGAAGAAAAPVMCCGRGQGCRERGGRGRQLKSPIKLGVANDDGSFVGVHSYHPPASPLDRGVILGLSGVRCVPLASAVGVVIFATLQRQDRPAWWSQRCWLGPLVASAYVRVRGRVVVEWLPVGVHYGARRVAGQTRYRASVGHPRRGAPWRCPAMRPRLRVSTTIPSRGRAWCMTRGWALSPRSLPSLTPPISCCLLPRNRPGSNGWGNVIASLAADRLRLGDPGPGIDCPDPRCRGRRLVEGPWCPRRLVGVNPIRDAARRRPGGIDYPSDPDHRGVGHADRPAKLTAPGRGIKGAAAVLRGDMAGVEHSLRAAELRSTGGSTRPPWPRRYATPTTPHVTCNPTAGGDSIDGRPGRGQRGMGSPAPRLGVLDIVMGGAMAPHRATLRLLALAGVRAGP